jgi:periplasmic protein TonB
MRRDDQPPAADAAAGGAHDMFDLTADPARRAARNGSLGASAVAILAHLAGLAVVIAVPVAHVVRVDTEAPGIHAFVVPSDLPPRPASPPVPAAAPPRGRRPATIPNRAAAPTEAPDALTDEAAASPLREAMGGVEGGIDGGSAGGVAGGLAGGLGEVVMPVAPPPERTRARAAAPFRVSGALKPPDLLHRVDPVYSPLAAASHLSAVVILEAVVGVEGAVESVTTVQSGNPLLDRAAMDALKQWKYAPLLLAGAPVRFVVLATFKFRFPGVVAASASTSSDR